MPKLKRMVTDPETGERTAMVSRNKSGKAEWKVTKEYNDDVARTKQRMAIRRQKVEELKRMIA